MEKTDIPEEAMAAAEEVVANITTHPTWIKYTLAVVIPLLSLAIIAFFLGYFNSVTDLVKSSDSQNQNQLPVSSTTSNETATTKELANTDTSTITNKTLDSACLGKDAAFALYFDTLNVYCDDTYMYIEANSLADHEMMVGITAWNHQVPIPQSFTNNNAWKIPLYPEIVATPEATVGQGPIGVAINGVMIYNPTKQDGNYSLDSDPFLVGELGVCGGHSGRADDYHYHIAPNCILDEVGEAYTLPIGYALDGYPIYTYLNADGSTPVLDECGGETDADGNYHYHAQKAYPYVNGCFTGKFDISLQPHTEAVRETNPLGHGQQVEITRLDYQIDDWSELDYIYQGATYTIQYQTYDTCYEFRFSRGTENLTTQTYCPGDEVADDTTGAGNQQPPTPPSNPSNGTTGEGGRKYCGDGICDDTETASSCSTDCS